MYSELVITHEGCFSQLLAPYQQRSSGADSVTGWDIVLQREVYRPTTIGYIVLRGPAEAKNDVVAQLNGFRTRVLMLEELHRFLGPDHEPTILENRTVAPDPLVAILGDSRVWHTWPIVLRFGDGNEHILVAGAADAMDALVTDLERLGHVDHEALRRDQFVVRVQSWYHDVKLPLELIQAIRLLRDITTATELADESPHREFVKQLLWEVIPDLDSVCRLPKREIEEVQGRYGLAYDVARKEWGQLREAIALPALQTAREIMNYSFSVPPEDEILAQSGGRPR